MGKLARLNAAKGGSGYSTWVAMIRRDFSYFLLKKDAEGKEIKEKVENLAYIPLTAGKNYTPFFASQQELIDWLRILAQKIEDKKSMESFLDLDIRALEVKYTPDRKQTYDHLWVKAKAKQDIPVETKRLVSSKVK